MGIFEAFGSLAKHAAISYLQNNYRGKKVVNLTIDNERKLINVDVHFTEDDEHIQAQAKYSLVNDPDEGMAVHIEDLNVSKHWLEVLLRPMMKRKHFHIPGEFAEVAKLFI